MSTDKTVLITGASRGLGLTFAKHYTKAGWKVIGTARNVDKANELKALSPLRLCRWTRAMKIRSPKWPRSSTASPSICSSTTPESSSQAPGRGRRGLAIVASVTSILGSIEVNLDGAFGPLKKVYYDNHKLPNGEMYGYRASKSALNMINANLAMELKKDKISMVVLQPGYVKTDLNHGGGAIDPETSIAGMTKVLSTVTLEDTSKFYDFQGPELPCMVHPELVKFVSFQKERVARRDAEQPAHNFGRVTNTDLSNLSPEQQMDLSFQLKYLRQYWHSHLRFFGLNPELPGVVQRALMYRNKVSHQSHMTLAQYEAAIATFEKLADIIECNSTIRQQIKELVTKLLSFSPLGKKLAAAEAPEDRKQVENKDKSQDQESKAAEDAVLMPPTASLDQILQHEYLYDGDVNEEPLWLELKLIGNDYFKEGNYTEAIEAYSQGLVVAPNQAVLYGNRARCYLRLKKFSRAREDAENALEADNYENIKYYRLLSETLMGMKDFDEAKEICDQGLELGPEDMVLRSRKRTAESMIAEEKAAYEKEKKRLELEERAKVEAANAAAAAKAIQEATSRKNKAKKKKNTLKNTAPEMELVAMINYQEVPAKWIEVHTRGSRRLEMYQQGMESLVVAAKALLQVTDSIGMPGRSRLPLDQLVKEGMANLRKAGEAGVAEAWFRLGVLYSSSVRKGMPLTADPHRMLECFHKAASLRPFIKPPGNRVFPHQGVGEAENELGVCYRDGRPASVVEADPKKAFHFFLRSAEHDYPLGQYHVAIAYSNGSGTPVDAFAARMWTSRAAQHGLPEAQQYLAQLFEKGYGGRRDETQAREWSLTASQNRLTDLLMKHDFADVGVTAFGGGKIADKFASNPTASQRGKEVFQQFYDAYLDEKGNGESAFDAVDSDGEEIQITKVSSYTPSATSSSDHMGRSGNYRPSSAVIDAEIQARARNGGITACKYLESEKLLGNASKLLAVGDIKGALRYLKKADLRWERPKGVFSTTSSADLLPKVLKEAAVSLQINPRDIDAAYVLGRWEMMSDQDIILHWKRCVKMHPNEASFHFYLGVAYLTLQRYNDAMDAMEAALAIEKKPDWLYWFAAPMIGLGMIDPALAVYKEYVDSNPPDERFIPDAYYSIGALYFKKYDNAMATVYHELGQMAESSPSAFLPFTLEFFTILPRIRFAPKFHFAGAIVEVTKGKNNYTVFSLQTVINQRWTLRVDHSTPPSGSSAVFDAEVDNSVLVFWRRPPPLEMVDRRALAVPMEGDVYGQDVVIYVLKCSSQALAFELCQLRHNKYMENGTLCAGCGNPPYFGEGLSACGACKAVKYCTRDCQRVHWKRVHRHMCKKTSLLRFCTMMTEDVTPDERAGKKSTGRQTQAKKDSPPPNISREEVVYVDDTVEILEGILETVKSKAIGPELAEYYMLPRDPSRPNMIEGSVRIFSRAKEFVVEFSIGYLTSAPNVLQQEELHYFFQIPPHNPLKLKSDGSQVFLNNCKVYTDDDSARGFRLVTEMSLGTYSLLAIAELLDYLLSNTNLYLA
ncbi:Tetratricopeptide repeat [Phytophthora cactorum]|nr:Tetratricopeptide repeat [Phytophthora cactorum]